MADEIVVPFALTASGGIALTTDPDTIARQHVTSLVSTTPGERVMVPLYGVDLTGQLFGNSDVVAAAIVNDVETAMGTWEPSITLNNVTAVPNADQETGAATVEVDYTTPTATGAQTISTATILVGGTVVVQVGS